MARQQIKLYTSKHTYILYYIYYKRGIIHTYPTLLAINLTSKMVYFIKLVTSMDHSRRRKTSADFTFDFYYFLHVIIVTALLNKLQWLLSKAIQSYLTQT